MSKLKIEKGASKVRRAPLKATIDGAVADDLELMCEWSENESSYLVNLLLGFAIAQSEGFQKYKAGRVGPSPTVRTKTEPVLDPARKTLSPASSASLQPEKGANGMNLATHLRGISRSLVEYRMILSLGLSAASGIAIQSLYPVNDADPLLHLLGLEQPAIFHGLVWSYGLFLYSTPFLFFSILFSLAYIHLYEPRPEEIAGALPPYPDPRLREELFLVAGEVHRQLKPLPSAYPSWLCISERGLYTGVCVVGAIGSGKTKAFILPAMRQLFAYRADDPQRRLSGIVLEVKGDLCRQVRAILKGCGRAEGLCRGLARRQHPLQPAQQRFGCLRPGIQHRVHHHCHLGQRQRTVLAAVLYRPCPVRHHAASRPRRIRHHARHLPHRHQFRDTGRDADCHGTPSRPYRIYRSQYGLTLTDTSPRWRSSALDGMRA